MANSELSPKTIALMNLLADALSANSGGEDPWVRENVQVIYANPKHPGGSWSMRGEKENEFVDCPTNGLRGRISRLWYTKREDGKIRWYLRLEFGNQSFVIQSFHGRVFSRSMLAAIAMMTVKEIQEEVTIQCNPSKPKDQEGTMQFCVIHTGDRTLNPPKIEHQDVGKIAKIAQSLVAGACGYEYQPGGQPDDSSQVESQSEPASSTAQEAPDYDDIPF